jgi:D-tyrosyl-tRNA(Tyr) deacylase
LIGLLQRVRCANVRANDQAVARIDSGLLVLVGVQKGDDRARADRLLERLLSYRVFMDADGKMNLCLRDVSGGLLLVPQFTLAADTRKGRRPSFSSAAGPEKAEELFDYLVAQAHTQLAGVQSGVFGTDMQVSLVNDGPVTFWLET